MNTVLVWRDDRLRCASVESSGALGATQPFPEGIPIGAQLVIADFALLSDPELFASSGRSQIAVLQPEAGASLLNSPPGSSLTDRPIDVRACAHRWIGAPKTARAVISQAEVALVAPLLHMRSGSLAFVRHTASQLYSLLVRELPEYARAIAPSGQLLAQALTLLRLYPTPERLRQESELHVQNMLASLYGVANSGHMSGVLQFHAQSDDTTLAPVQAAHIVRAVQGAIDMVEVQLRHVADIDQSIYALALSRFQQDGTASTPRDGGGSIFDLPTRPDAMERDFVPEDVPSVRASLGELQTKAASRQRQPKLDFDRLEILHGTIEQLDDATKSSQWSPHDALQLTLLGQRLALASHGFFAAARFWSATQRELQDSGAQLSLAERANADIVSAITGLITSNVPVGFADLRQALNDHRAAEADAAVLFEARGLTMLVLVLYGADKELMSFLAEEVPVPGSVELPDLARAGRAVTELLVVATNPDTPDEAVAALIAHADASSAGTYYRPFFNFAMMTLSYVTRDRDAAMQNYAELQRDGVWEQHTPSLFAQAQLARAFHLASAGQFGAARRQAKEIRVPNEHEGSATFTVQRDLFMLYLDLAVSDLQRILDATDSEGELGEQRLTREDGAVRFLPASLVLRGTALVRRGIRAQGEALFRQATLLAGQVQAWIVLLCGETPEYRTWIEGLDDEDLPQGLSLAARARIVSRPLFFEYELPELTAQQQRILRSLALGHSASAIASELHITANTLKTHLRRLYARLGATNRAEAVQLADGYGLID